MSENADDRLTLAYATPSQPRVRPSTVTYAAAGLVFTPLVVAFAGVAFYLVPAERIAFPLGAKLCGTFGIAAVIEAIAIFGRSSIAARLMATACIVVAASAGVPAFLLIAEFFHSVWRASESLAELSWTLRVSLALGATSAGALFAAISHYRWARVLELVRRSPTE